MVVEVVLVSSVVVVGSGVIVGAGVDGSIVVIVEVVSGSLVVVVGSTRKWWIIKTYVGNTNSISNHNSKND